MEGGSYSASGDDRGRNSGVEIKSNNEYGTNFVLSGGASHSDDQTGYECADSKAGTRKGKYYREIGLFGHEHELDERETETERMRREYF